MVFSVVGLVAGWNCLVMGIIRLGVKNGCGVGPAGADFVYDGKKGFF